MSHQYPHQPGGVHYLPSDGYKFYQPSPLFLRQRTIAFEIPSAERVAKLKRKIDYIWQNKDLIIKAVTRRIKPTETTFADDTIIHVLDDAPVVLFQERFVEIEHGVFDIELWRNGCEWNGFKCASCCLLILLMFKC